MSTRIKQARLTIEELHELKWLSGGALTLLALWALSSLELQSGLHLLVGSLLICLGLLMPRRVAQLPAFIWKMAGPLVLVVTLIDFAMGLTNFFPPLMRMVMLLLIYRALAPRTRREDLQLVLLCLFALVVSGTLTVSLVFAVQMLFFSPVALALLFVICVLDRGPEFANEQPTWRNYNGWRLLRRVWQVLDIRVLAVGSALFIFVVAASTCLFILIPRFNLEQAIPFLELQTKPKSGFSDSVELGSVAEITEDHSIALRIDVPSLEAIASTPYWRILVLDQYRSGGFKLSDNMRGFRKFERFREFYGWDQWELPLQHRKGQRWSFYFEGGVSQYLPMPGAFHSIRFPTQQDIVLMSDLYVMGLDSVPSSTFSYQVEDVLWDIRAPASRAEIKAFRKASDAPEVLDEGDLIQYPLTALELNISEEDRQLLKGLNQQVVGDAKDLSAAGYSQLVTSYLRGNFRYSLKSDGRNGVGDPVVSWLTNGSMGHCELFAGAFVLLARDAGYPARMAVGFVGGGWNSVEDFFVVRNSDAHAWVEIYDATSKEWLRVDPTPGASPNDPEILLAANIEMESGMGAWIDSLRMQWYRRIVNFDQKDQVELATTMIDLGDSLIEGIIERIKELGASFRAWLLEPFDRSSVVRGICFCAIAIAFLGLWRTRYEWMHILSGWLRRPQGIGPVRKQATHYLARVRRRIEMTDTDESYLSDLNDVLCELEAIRFGPKVSSVFARQTFSRVKRLLRKRIKT